MPPPRGRLSYQGDPEAAGINLAKRTAAYAGEVQRQNIRAQRNNDMNALGKGIPTSALPAGGIHANMSKADQDAAVRAIDAYNGTTPAAAHMPGPTHMAPNVPQMGRPASPAAPASPAIAVPPTFDKDGNLKEAPGNSRGGDALDNVGAPKFTAAQMGANGVNSPTNPTVKARLPGANAIDAAGPKPPDGTPAAAAWAANVKSINDDIASPHDATQPKAAPLAIDNTGAGNRAPFRGSTPDEIKEFYANKPGSADSAAAKALTANAGTGNQVQTPYGTAQSTDATKGKGATWQEQIVAQHPTIGVKGSPENIAFVKAYRDAKSRGETPDHFALAENIAGPSGDQPLEPPRPEIAGSASGAIAPKSTAAQVGKAIHDAPGKAASAIANATGSAINSTVGAAKDLYAGLTGQQPTQPQPGDKTPAQVAGDAAIKAGNATLNAFNPFKNPPAAGGTPSPSLPTLPPGSTVPTPSQIAGLSPATAGSYAGAQAPTTSTTAGTYAGKDTDTTGIGVNYNDIPTPISYTGPANDQASWVPSPTNGLGPYAKNPISTPQPYSGDASLPQTASSDPHAAIHAATVKAITDAGQNAHNAANSSPSTAQPYTGNASPSASTPAPEKSQTADF